MTLLALMTTTSTPPVTIVFALMVLSQMLHLPPNHILPLRDRHAVGVATPIHHVGCPVEEPSFVK